MTLKDFLARRKLRAAEFSRLAGIPRCQISLYLSGRRRPGRDNALAIEEATDGKVPVSGWKVQDT